MAIDVKNQEILDYLGEMNGPVPGQSLTNNPDEPYPWEKSPQFVNVKDALYELFGMMTKPETYTEIVTALKDGMPVVNLTETILTDGFQKGAWNPDLMVQLIEPTMYMVMSMAEKAGVQYKIDEEDDPNLEEVDGEREKEFFTEFEKAVNTKSKDMSKSSIPQEIQKELDNVEVPSLLGKPETIETASLLAPTEGVM
jgi:hypothetical protein